MDYDIRLDWGNGEENKYSSGIILDNDGIVINGNGHVIDAQGKTRIFKCGGKNLIIKNITLKNGFVNGAGGAISNNGELTIINSNFNENSAINGGAILNNGDLSIIESKLNDNVVDEIFGLGGAIYNLGILGVIRSALSNNYSGNEGGAIASFGGKLVVVESEFSMNNAVHGGAIYHESTEYESNNCTFRDNNPDDVCE